MNDTFDIEDLREAAREAHRALEKKLEEVMEDCEQLEGFQRTLGAVNELIAENERLRNEVDDLEQQLESERQQRADVEMKLAEMNKLTTGMAKKSSEENVLKALRTYVNRSKRKTADKRAFAKSATLEIANVNGLDLPEDLKAAIESLDDEQTEPKVVTVQGNYNDVHDNGEVKVEK